MFIHIRWVRVGVVGAGNPPPTTALSSSAGRILDTGNISQAYTKSTLSSSTTSASPPLLSSASASTSSTAARDARDSRNSREKDQIGFSSGYNASEVCSISITAGSSVGPGSNGSGNNNNSNSVYYRSYSRDEEKVFFYPIHS